MIGGTGHLWTLATTPAPAIWGGALELIGHFLVLAPWTPTLGARAGPFDLLSCHNASTSVHTSVRTGAEYAKRDGFNGGLSKDRIASSRSNHRLILTSGAFFGRLQGGPDRTTNHLICA